MLPTTFATSYEVIFLIITDIVKDKNRIEDLSASELIQPYSSMRIDMILQFQAYPYKSKIIIRLGSRNTSTASAMSEVVVRSIGIIYYIMPIANRHIFTERSSWFRSHPVSKIAITTDELPVDRSQPLEASILAMGHGLHSMCRSA